MRNIMNITLLLLTLLAFCPLSGLAQNVSLRFDQPPHLLVDAGTDKTIISGSSIQLGATPTAQFGYGDYVFFWEPQTGLDHPNTPNPIAIPEVTTTYLLTVIDDKNCKQQDEVTITVEPNSVNPFLQTGTIRIYPNPSQGQVSIESNWPPGEIRIRVFNSVGATIREERKILPFHGRLELDLADLPNGWYFLHLNNAEQMFKTPLLIY